MIQIISTKKIKNASYLAAMQEYQKRLSPYTKIKVLSFAEYVPDKKEFLIAVKKSGDTVSSEALSDQLGRLMLKGYSVITFCFAPKIPADACLCISNMKLSEALTLTVLHEQLYRSFMIMQGRTYHK